MAPSVHQNSQSSLKMQNQQVLGGGRGLRERGEKFVIGIASLAHVIMETETPHNMPSAS